jgi:hypothetical protein
MASARTSQAGIVEIAHAAGSGTIPASGNSVSADAYFYYNTSDPKTLIIDLVNSTSGGSLVPADILLGLVFEIHGNPEYATAPSAHNLSASLTLSGLGTTSTVLGGSSWTGTNTWTNQYQGGNSNINNYNGDLYGIAANGFNGAFKGQGLGNGNNGAVATGTVNTTNFQTHAPLAVNGVELTLAFKTDISGVSLSNIQFLFGSEGTGVVPGEIVNPVPEPSSIAAFSIGLVGLAIMRRRRRAA